MQMENNLKRSVLLAGRKTWDMNTLFKNCALEPVIVSDISSLMQMEGIDHFLFLMITVHNRDELQAAATLASLHEKIVLLFIPDDLYDMAVYLTRESDVFCLKMSTADALLEEILVFVSRIAGSKEKFLHVLEQEKKQRQEDQMVSRCKMQLIEQLHWSEQKAHDYIVHAAMKNHAQKARVARAIMRKLEAQKQNP